MEDIVKCWTLEENKLVRTIIFENFKDATEFISKIATIADKANHHPDVSLFSYNKVKISLQTHSAGNKVTQKDIALAKELNALILTL